MIPRKLLMAGLELRSYGIRSNHSAKFATTIALRRSNLWYKVWHLNKPTDEPWRVSI